MPGCGLFGRLGLAKADDAVPFLPLVALAEEFDAFEPLEHVALGAKGRRAAEAVVLRHKSLKSVVPARIHVKRGRACTTDEPRDNSRFLEPRAPSSRSGHPRMAQGSTCTGMPTQAARTRNSAFQLAKRKHPCDSVRPTSSGFGVP